MTEQLSLSLFFQKEKREEGVESVFEIMTESLTDTQV